MFEIGGDLLRARDAEVTVDAVDGRKRECVDERKKERERQSKEVEEIGG